MALRLNKKQIEARYTTSYIKNPQTITTMAAQAEQNDYKKTLTGQKKKNSKTLDETLTPKEESQN